MSIKMKKIIVHRLTFNTQHNGIIIHYLSPNAIRLEHNVPIRLLQQLRSSSSLGSVESNSCWNHELKLDRSIGWNALIRGWLLCGCCRRCWTKFFEERPNRTMQQAQAVSVDLLCMASVVPVRNWFRTMILYILIISSSGLRAELRMTNRPRGAGWNLSGYTKLEKSKRFSSTAAMWGINH